MIYGIFYSGDVSTLRCYGENDACYFVRAIGNNNTQDCNQIRNNSSKERCLTTLALTTDSPSICYTLKEPSPQVYAKTNTEYCLNLLMGKYGKENRLTEKFCIENPPIANVCYSTLVHIEDDISYCYKINDQGNTIYNTQKSCVMNTIKWDYDKKNPKNFTSADCEFMKDDPIAEQSCYKKLKDPTVAFCYNGGCS